eukprot:8388058-Pyramimonas_sp.AAC.1
MPPREPEGATWPNVGANPIPPPLSFHLPRLWHVPTPRRVGPRAQLPLRKRYAALTKTAPWGRYCATSGAVRLTTRLTVKRA